MQVVLSTGYPAWRDLWYYNDMVIEMYVDWKVDNSERIKSTKETNGVFPFDGLAVWHVQSNSEAGGAERATGSGAYIRSGKCLMTFAATKTISTP